MELNCENVRDMLLLYKAGELSPGSARAVEAHLAECKECARFFAEQKDFIEVRDRMETKTPSKLMAEELAARISTFRIRILKVMIGAAVLLLLIGYVVPVLHSRHSLRGARITNLEQVEAPLAQLHSAVIALNENDPARAIIDSEDDIVYSTWWQDHFQAFWHIADLLQTRYCEELVPDFIALLYLRQQHGVDTERDRQALVRMDELLAQYRLALADIRGQLDRWLGWLRPVDTRRARELSNQISLLSQTYTFYNLFPEETLSRRDVESRVARITGVGIESVAAEPHQSHLRIPLWSFVVNKAGQVQLQGIANGYTGGILSIEPTAFGPLSFTLDSETDVEQACFDLVRQILNPELELEANSGLYYDEGQKMEQMMVQILPGGYKVYEGSHAKAFFIDLRPLADRMALRRLSLQRGMANVDLCSLPAAEPLLTPAEALAQINTDGEWQYAATVFIHSLLNGEAVLVHQYARAEKEAEDEMRVQPLFIDAVSGKREWSLYTLPQLPVVFHYQR